MALGTRTMFWLAVALQVLALVVFVGAREYTLRSGEEVVLATVPVDPRDLFRGDYVVLRYEISTVPGRYAVGDTLYVLLVERGDGAWRMADVTREPPGSEATFLRGHVVRQTQSAAKVAQAEVEYGIESYFVPEGTGRKIEQASGKLKVRVAVDPSGNAAIKELLLDQP